MLPKDFYEEVRSNCVKASEDTQDILLTIAIPTYKRAEMLEEAINSALLQDVTGWGIKYEVIVVSNNPEADLSYFIDKYKDVKNISFYINEKNTGLAGNMNRGAMLAKGKYVAYLHDDDLLKPNYIKEISKYLLDERYNDALCFIPDRDFIWLTEPDVNNQNINIIKQGPIKIFIKTLIRKSIEKLIDASLYFRRKKSCRKDKDIFEMKPEMSLFMFANIYGEPSCGSAFNKEKFFEAGGWGSEGGMLFDWYSFLKFNENYKIYKLQDSLSIYRMGLNTSALRKTRIDFCRNGLALLDKKYKNPDINKHFAKYRKLLKQIEINSFKPDEQEEIYTTLKIKRYEPSRLEMILYRISRYYYVKLYDQDDYLIKQM